MKRKFLYGCISLVMIFALAFFAAPAKISRPDEETNLACSSLAVGISATEDGSVLFGHNEDDSGKVVTRLHLVPRLYHEPGEVIEMWDIKLADGTLATIPQVEGETWAYIWSEMPGFSFSDSYLNEWGVAIASDNCGPSREDKDHAELTPGIAYWLRRLVPERAKTAREGVEIMGAAVEEYGYNAPGRTYIVADPNETWLFSAVWGKHWCAQRVPDGHVAFIPNYYTIRQVNLQDTDNFLACPDLIKYTKKRGWYDPSNGPFDFARVYGGTAQASLSNKIRHWGALRLLIGTEYPNMDNLPFSVVPNRQLSVQDIIEVLRCHYEDTEWDQRELGPNGDPHHVDTHLPKYRRSICTTTTQESFVMQLRSYMPSAIGNIYWRTQGRPCESSFVPWYWGILKIPKPYATGEPAKYDDPLDTRYYDPESAYWVFNRMDTLVDMEYNTREPLVRSFWDSFEEEEFARQHEIEMDALEIYYLDEELARELLTRYTKSRAMDAYDKALEFIKVFKKH